jgi:hypothetical protein
MSEFDRVTALTATPIIITAEMDDAQFEYEFGLMQIRARAAADLIVGHISIDDYLDTLAECDVDVDEALECWTSDSVLMHW